MAQRSGILHFLTQQQDVIQTQIFLDPNLATESKPGRCMSPLDWTRVPRKTHGTLCTTAGEACSFSAASETSLSNGRIQGGQVAPTRGIPPHHLVHPLYPLCLCRLETPLPHKEISCHRQEKIHQNSCSFDLEASCPHPNTSWMPRETCSRDPVTTSTHPEKCFLSHPGREILPQQVLGSEIIFLTAGLRSSTTKKHPVTGPGKHLLPLQALPARTGTPNKPQRPK